jgi:hypothetical protein
MVSIVDGMEKEYEASWEEDRALSWAIENIPRLFELIRKLEAELKA